MHSSYVNTKSRFVQTENPNIKITTKRVRKLSAKRKRTRASHTSRTCTPYSQKQTYQKISKKCPRVFAERKKQSQARDAKIRNYSRKISLTTLEEKSLFITDSVINKLTFLSLTSANFEASKALINMDRGIYY